MTSQNWADEILAGWHAAKWGRPMDPHASSYWREGWTLYKATRREP